MRAKLDHTSYTFIDLTVILRYNAIDELFKKVHGVLLVRILLNKMWKQNAAVISLNSLFYLNLLYIY